MKRTLLFLLSALTVMTMSCCDCRKAQKLEKPLQGTTWQLVQIMAKDVTPAGESFTIVFHSDDTVSGQGDCNRFTATYTTSDKRDLHIENIGSTRRLCPNQEAENAFFEMLDKVTHYEMDADKMLFLSEGTLVAILQSK